MQIPDKPPVWGLTQLPQFMDTFLKRHRELERISTKLRYPHWDQIRHRPPPEGLSAEESWYVLKFGRVAGWKPLPFTDKKGSPFSYGMPDPVPEELHEIDQNFAGLISIPESVKNPATRDRYLVSSLVAESIRSSQIEGAVTTRKAAKEMMRTGRKPRTRGEQMVLNNYSAMQRIREIRNDPLSPEVLLELHRILTRDTLDDAADCGRFRSDSDNVRVEDEEGQIIHVPPPVEGLRKRLDLLCKFANREIPDGFLHPVLRAIILHFWLAYDHPFIDGNGRCARAVFYWSMLHEGYWLVEFLSISEVVYKARQQYYRAFLYTETDDSDVTYFILYHLTVILQAFAGLRAYIDRKARESREIERNLRNTLHLNHRQKDLIRHALRHPEASYTIEGHRRSHGVVYQTARADLLNLVDQRLLTSRKQGRLWVFAPVRNLERKIHPLKRVRADEMR